MAVLLCFPQRAEALCVNLGVGLSGIPATATFSGGSGGYNSFDGAEYMQSVNFNVSILIAALNCRYYVVATAGSSGNANQRELDRGGLSQLDYNIYTTAGKAAVIKDNASAGAGDRINGMFGGLAAVGATQAHTFYWTPAPSQVVAADPVHYEDTVTFELYAELAGGIYTKIDQHSITFRAAVESSVDLSLVDSGGAFNIGDTAQTVDFGDLSPGEFLAYDTIIRSNDGYSVTIESQNGQAMKHQTETDTVPYTLTFGGNGVNLTGGPATAASSTAVTPATGDRFDTVFTIGGMTGAEPAGNYQDVLTVTVTAN